jgi:ribosome maturation factor RimP
MMYVDVIQLEEELDGFLHDFGFQAVDMHIAGRGPARVFRLFIEHVDDSPVTIQDCTDVSPQVRLFLEMKGCYNDNSSLEVSSGGLDRVLKRDRDFERYLGHEVRVAHHMGARKEVLTGELSSFTDEMLVITVKVDGQSQAHQIGRDSLERVNLVPHLEI